MMRQKKTGQTRLWSFFGLPTPFEAARRGPKASICALNRSPPSAQPLCVQSRISARALPEMAAWNNSR